jgi:molybdate transport system substrate-binding protein
MFTKMNMKKSVFVVALLLVTSQLKAQDSSHILVAAASDLKFALDSVILVYEKSNPGDKIDVTYGSSGKLYEQISHTAPFDIFFSADIEYPLNLKKKGITSSHVFHYGRGRLVIWSRKKDPNILGIKSLEDKAIVKVAIANPAHAPYGRRAEEALIHYKLYESLKNKLVMGENISQTAQFVTTGAADIGIVALSLALSPTMKKQHGYYYLIPESSHKPLDQGFVILKRAERNQLALKFKDFMLSDDARQIMRSFGFAEKQ